MDKCLNYSVDYRTKEYQFRVEDKEGRQCIMTFDDSDRGAAFQHVAIPGNTVAFIDADLHGFMDGQIGIRLEDHQTGGRYLKILPFQLSELLKGNDIIQRRADERKCEHCSKSEGNLRNCARCQTLYCSQVCIQTLTVAYKCVVYADFISKECQTANWSKDHKQLCKLIKEVIWFAEQDGQNAHKDTEFQP